VPQTLRSPPVPLADLEDINVHLPTDKIEVDSAQYVLLQLDAERIVRGYLAGQVASTTLATWDTPEHTPEIIRAIAGRLVAAFWYRKRYSEDSLEDPQYAQNKYNEAVLWLQNIINGIMVIPDADGEVPQGGVYTNLDFWPNEGTEGPYFTMSQDL
jgi:hypothetical protein